MTSRNRIHYLKKPSATSSLALKVMQMEAFDPLILVNNAITLCSLPNQHLQITSIIEPELPKVIGNARLYFQGITLLLNALVKNNNHDIIIKLKSKEKNDKIELELIASMPIHVPDLKKNPSSQKSPSSIIATFKKDLNYELFLLRKILNKIDGELLIEQHNESIICFSIRVKFLKSVGNELNNSAPNKSLIPIRSKKTKPVSSPQKFELLNTKISNNSNNLVNIVYKTTYKPRNK